MMPSSTVSHHSCTSTPRKDAFPISVRTGAFYEGAGKHILDSVLSNRARDVTDKDLKTLASHLQTSVPNRRAFLEICKEIETVWQKTQRKAIEQMPVEHFMQEREMHAMDMLRDAFSSVRIRRGRGRPNPAETVVSEYTDAGSIFSRAIA